MSKDNPKRDYGVGYGEPLVAPGSSPVSLVILRTPSLTDFTAQAIAYLTCMRNKAAIL